MELPTSTSPYLKDPARPAGAAHRGGAQQPQIHVLAQGQPAGRNPLPNCELRHPGAANQKPCCFSGNRRDDQEVDNQIYSVQL